MKHRTVREHQARLHLNITEWKWLLTNVFVYYVIKKRYKYVALSPDERCDDNHSQCMRLCNRSE